MSITIEKAVVTGNTTYYDIYHECDGCGWDVGVAVTRLSSGHTRIRMEHHVDRPGEEVPSAVICGGFVHLRVPYDPRDFDTTAGRYHQETLPLFSLEEAMEDFLDAVLEFYGE